MSQSNPSKFGTESWKRVSAILLVAVMVFMVAAPMVTAEIESVDTPIVTIVENDSGIVEDIIDIPEPVINIEEDLDIEEIGDDSPINTQELNTQESGKNPNAKHKNGTESIISLSTNSSNNN